MYFPVNGSREAVERVALIAGNVFGDDDGWVDWARARPPLDTEVQINRAGYDEIDNIVRCDLPLEWNCAGVRWRLPRPVPSWYQEWSSAMAAEPLCNP